MEADEVRLDEKKERWSWEFCRMERAGEIESERRSEDRKKKKKKKWGGEKREVGVGFKSGGAKDGGSS